jgi:hypothetical protein
MNFTFLSPPLHQIAEQAKEYFHKNWGIPNNRFKVEAKINKEIEYCPTISADTNDHHILCIDVSDKVYNPSLDSFVIDCMNHHLPVKLYIAIAREHNDPNYQANLRSASSRGVGLIEFSENHQPNIVKHALSLSLMGLTPVEVKQFPPKYRQTLHDAEQQFRGGDPVKASAMVFELAEAHTRKLAKKASKRGWWHKPPAASLNLDSCSWANILKHLQNYFDQTKAGFPKCTDVFFGSLLGLTIHRNDSNHPPKDFKARLKRDQEQRTRFENGCNVLRDFVEATK